MFPRNCFPVASTARSWSPAGALLALILCATSGVLAATTWPVVLLKDSAGHPVGPIAINDHDDYAGTIVPSLTSTVFTGVYSTGATLHTIAVPGGNSATSVQPLGMNNHGDVVGYFVLGSGSLPHAFLIKSGAFNDLTNQLGALSGMALAVNDAGEVCGQSDGSGFILEPNGSVIHLGVAIPSCINASGHVVGYVTQNINSGGPYAFWFGDLNHNDQIDAGEILPLPNGGMQTTFQVWLNDTDQICGTLKDSQVVSHAATWAGPRAQPVLLPGAPTLGSQAYCMNNSGDVVGLNQGSPSIWIKSGQPAAITPNIIGNPNGPQVAHVDRINNLGHALGSVAVNNPVGAFFGAIIKVAGAGGGGTGSSGPANLSATWGALTWTKSGTRKVTYTLHASLAVSNSSTTRSAKTTGASFFASADTQLGAGDTVVAAKNGKPISLKIGMVPDLRGANPVTFTFSYTLPPNVAPQALAGKFLIVKIPHGQANGTDTLAASAAIPAAP